MTSMEKQAKNETFTIYQKQPPPPKSSTRAIYISKIGMAAKQHFLNQDNNKNRGHTFRTCMLACLIVCLDQNWTFPILRLLMLSVYDVKQPPQPQDAEAKLWNKHRAITIHSSIMHSSAKCSRRPLRLITTCGQQMYAYMYTKYRSQNRSTPGSEPCFVLQALFLAALNTLNALSKNLEERESFVCPENSAMEILFG